MSMIFSSFEAYSFHAFKFASHNISITIACINSASYIFHQAFTFLYKFFVLQKTPKIYFFTSTQGTLIYINVVSPMYLYSYFHSVQ